MNKTISNSIGNYRLAKHTEREAEAAQWLLWTLYNPKVVSLITAQLEIKYRNVKLIKPLVISAKRELYNLDKYLLNPGTVAGTRYSRIPKL